MPRWTAFLYNNVWAENENRPDCHTKVPNHEGRLGDFRIEGTQAQMNKYLYMSIRTQYM